MPRARIAAAIAGLDLRGGEAGDEAWAKLRPLGFAVVPYLLDSYPKMRTWEGRCAAVYHSTRYSRISGEAFELGILALRDRSYMVRYRACGLLAYSLRKDALAALEDVSVSDDRDFVISASQAAINAIKAQNHNLFVDRRLSGASFWHLNAGDEEQALPSLPKRLMLGIHPVY